jgi:energy-coupling factor transporter ATP-binding protein EcfA2
MGFGTKYPGQLSGGMRQRAAFMRSCMFRQDFLLLDEPFSRLDYLTRSGMHQWFQQYLEGHDPGFILVTHDPREALMLCDRVLVLSSRPARLEDVILVDSPRPPESREPGYSSRPRSPGKDCCQSHLMAVICLHDFAIRHPARFPPLFNRHQRDRHVGPCRAAVVRRGIGQRF